MKAPVLPRFSVAKKQLALLIDPDSYSTEKLRQTIEQANYAGVDFIFIGGSLLVSGHLDQQIEIVKEMTNIPVVIFPGSPDQISSKADALLLLSVISGRNPEMLIGQHVVAAPRLRKSGLEILPTGYMLIDSGAPTTASYISNTTPIPSNKPAIAACTAMAGEMLGLKLIYLDGGSGAKNTVQPALIEAVKKSVTTPVIVGGGMRDAEAVDRACRAGADVVVVGNVVEDNATILSEMCAAAAQIKVSA